MNFVSLVKLSEEKVFFLRLRAERDFSIVPFLLTFGFFVNFLRDIPSAFVTLEAFFYKLSMMIKVIKPCRSTKRFIQTSNWLTRPDVLRTFMNFSRQYDFFRRSRNRRSKIGKLEKFLENFLFGKFLT